MIDKTRFVGRKSEVQFLTQAVARAVSGGGGIILIGGEAGIGKTTLVNQVLKICADAPVVTLMCRCPGPGETSPYGPWREAILYLQLQNDAWDPSLLPAPFGSEPALTEPFEVALSLIRWLRSLGQPMILTIDDLQWSDKASIDLLQQLSGRLNGVPLLVIGVYRTEDFHRTHEMRSVFFDIIRTGSQQILLNEINRLDIQELITVMLPHVADPSGLAAEVDRLTNGLPLFVAEILEQLKHSNSSKGKASANIQHTIDRKLSLLDPAYLSVLEEASQIGEQFSYNLLVQISIHARETVTAALNEAKQIGLVWKIDFDSDRFQFRHAIVRSNLANRMLGDRLEQCHQTIASVLERTSSEATDLIAFHYRKANDPRSVLFLVQAGDNALRIGALLDAEERYQEALELLPELNSLRAEVLLKLGFCMRGRQDTAAALHFDSALVLAGQSGDLPLQAWVRYFIYERAYIHGDRVILEDIAAFSSLQDELLLNQRYLQLEQLFFGENSGCPRIVMVYWSFLYTHGKLDEAKQVLDDLQNRVGDHNAHVIKMKSRLSAFMGRLDESISLALEMSKVTYLQHNYLTAVTLFTNYAYHAYLSKTDRPDHVDTVIGELIQLENEIHKKKGITLLPKGYSASGFYDYTRGNWELGRKNLVDYVIAETEPDPLMTWFAAVMVVETADTANLDSVVAKLAPFRPTDPPPASTTVFTWVHAIRAQAHLLRGEVKQAKEWLEAADAHPLSRVLVWNFTVR